MRQQAAMQAGARPGPRELRPRPVKARRPPQARLALLQGAVLLAMATRRSVSAAIALGNIGAAMIYSGVTGEARRPLRFLGMATGTSFGVLDLRRGRWPSGLAHLALAAAWAGVEIFDRARKRRRPEAAFA